MSTLDDVFRSIGLLWERVHLFSPGTVQTAGMTSRWMQDLEPVGDRSVLAGEEVALQTTVEHQHQLPAKPKIRFDILEFDWLFSGGFDDPVTSLKSPDADAPSGDFTIVERVLSETDYAGKKTLREVVDDHRVQHVDDYEHTILIVRETDRPDTGRTEVITWWRAQHVDESDPSLYFVAELADVRDSSSVPLRVAKPQAGVNLRLHGKVLDVDPMTPDAQPVPDARITCGSARARTTPAGAYVVDARLPIGTTTLKIARPGIDDRRVGVQVSAATGGGYTISVFDVDAGNVVLQTGSVAQDADGQGALVLELNLRARVHRLRGVVTWPDTRVPATGAPALTLANRRVYAVPLAPGPALAQRPRTTREWDLLHTRPGLLRSARPDRPVQAELTDANGAFELSFINLVPGAQYLLWVRGPDPRTPQAEVCDVVVRTTAAPSMRQMNGDHANQQDTTNRRVVDSTYNLLADTVAGAVEIVRIVDTAPPGSAADLHLFRPGRVNPAGIDAAPVVDAEEIAYSVASHRASGLVVETLPLVPVFEPADVQSALARTAGRRMHEQLDKQYPRGHLVAGCRWVLDAARCTVVAAAWNSAANVGLLEETLITQPLLRPEQINRRSTAAGRPFDWSWWRIDAVSLADFARIELPASQLFATRSLATEFVSVLTPPVPRLLGLFPRCHLMVSPGHGLFAQPPLGTGAAQQLSARGGWPQFAGEDENTAVIAMEIARTALANGAVCTGSREMEDLTLPGLVQTGANAFSDSTNADFPRLWQQNAYYWIADRWDPLHAGQEIVIAAGGSGTKTTANAATDPNGMRKNVDGINARIALFRLLAADPGRPVNAFLAIHSNGGLPTAHGTESLYLDVRPTSTDPAPGAGTYQEANQVGLRFASLIQSALVRACQTNDRGTRSYFANGNPIAELRDTLTHFRAFTTNTNGTLQFPVQAVRAFAPDPALNSVQFPQLGGHDIPVGYVEVAFHSSADDVQRLAQRWFRRAAGVALATAAETMIGEHPEPISGDDLLGLITRTFGATTAVQGLTPPATPSPNDVSSALATVTGQNVVPASAVLGHVVAALETARQAATRTDVVQRLHQTLATIAGYDPTDATQATEIARAALAPMLSFAGATGPTASAVPALGDLPRGSQPPTRADTAAFVAAGLGLRPATLTTICQPINAVTLLAGVQPEAPEAFLSASTMTELITAAGRLRPVDIYRLIAVDLTDPRLNLLGSASVVTTDEVLLVATTGGTAWRVGAADVQFQISRAGTPVALLDCQTREVDRLTSTVWSVPMPVGVTGPQTYSLSIRIRHPRVGVQTIGPLAFTLTVAAAAP